MARPTLEKKLDVLASVGQVPAPPRVDARSWLQQFAASDRRAGAAVGHALAFIPEKQFVHQIGDAIAAIEQVHTQLADKPLSATIEQLLDRCIYCCLDDGRRHLADSAFIIARHLRNSYSIDQQRIKTFSQTVQHLYFSRSPFPIVFIDDLLASGQQMSELWERPVPVGEGAKVTLAQLRSEIAGAWVFAPVFATSWGIARVQQDCAGLPVVYSELLTERDSLHSDHFADDDPGLAAEARAIIKSYHDKHSLPRKHDFTHFGYMDQGLGLVFHHGVPDCTVPLLYHESDTWSPLVRRGV